MTEREIFAVIANAFETIDNENRDEVLAFVEKKVAAIDRKNVKAREYAAKKRAASDEMTEAVYAILCEKGGEVVTIPEIVAHFGDEKITPSKVVARLTKLVKAGVVEKVAVKVGDRKLTGYKAIEEVIVEPEAE